MIKIGLVGASGKFGRSILESNDEIKKFDFNNLIANKRVGLLDPVTGSPFIPFDDLKDVSILVDVAGIYTLEPSLNYCISQQIPLIIGTTGHNPEQEANIRSASLTIPIFYAQNFSINLYAFLEMLKVLAPYSKQNCYIDLIERHRASKKDAPSGTAKKIAQELDMPYKIGEPSYERDSKLMHIHVIRGQDHAIEHEINFGFPYENIQLKHQVYDRKTYALGVLNAIEFIRDKKPGLYGMPDLAQNLLKK